MNAPANGAAPRIVVGVDGSDQSKLALRWAAHLAQLNAADLDAVMVWDYPATLGWSAALSYTSETWNPQADAEKLLAATIAEVYGSERPAGLRLMVQEGYCAKVLLERSEGALMLVVGSRGHGGFAGMLLGSVSANCAEHASCPVLVVHGGQPPLPG